jgi:hypothetical protein
MHIVSPERSFMFLGMSETIIASRFPWPRPLSPGCIC